MKYQLLILVILLVSCSESIQHAPTSLSDADEELIISEGYGDYLDSIGRKREIYCKYAVFEDTAEMSNMLYVMEGKAEHLLFPESIYRVDVLIGAYFDDSINPETFKNFTFFDHHYADSISLSWGISNTYYETPYAITRPFQPDTCSLAMIQEYPVPHAPGCTPIRCRHLIFQYKNDKWRLLKRI